MFRNDGANGAVSTQIKQSSLDNMPLLRTITLGSGDIPSGLSAGAVLKLKMQAVNQQGYSVDSPDVSVVLSNPPSGLGTPSSISSITDTTRIGI